MKTTAKMEKTEVRWGALVPACAITAGFIALGFTDEETLGESLKAALEWVSSYFGAFFLLFSLFIILITLGISFTRFGDIRLGGENARPDYSRTTWFVVALNGCIGTGILFWAMGEPIFHFAAPPAGAAALPFTREAAIFAVSQTMIHWTVGQYAMYSLAGLVIGILAYNFGRHLSITSFLTDLLPPKLYRFAATLIHGTSLCCIAGAVSCSLGVGLLQIASGLEHLAIVGSSASTWLLIDLVLGGVFLTSSLLGIRRGLSWISRICTAIFIFLMLWVLALGPTRFIADLGVTSFGMFLNDFIEHSLILPVMTPGETWSRDWNIQFTASFFVYAPVLGLFLARLARGRTVREFVWMNIVAPSVFCILWIAVWAGMTIEAQWTGALDIWKYVNERGMESTIFSLFTLLPASRFLTVIFCCAVFFSLATMCDAITGTMAILSSKNLTVEDHPPRSLKIFWGCAIAASAYILIASGGIVSVRSLFAIIGIPTATLLILYLWFLLAQRTRLAQSPVDALKAH